ncbi:hypothetical protein FC093_19130 [Ilyomonas limi]|uniref:Outer membrane protein beta-barrel domain-containing protein n=1 Tax=Ilyomonas limi TaxID=2575867 RepID=A0A4V6XAS7_9BACT|nr:hypothetical protein [Ilyomonas limi]TKK65653.1 hypothetical protein FC093_19130 [Ilyomonas limi]
MKKIYIVAFGLLTAMSAFSQEQNSDRNSSDYGELKGGFKQENIFVGGSLSLGFGSGQFTVGGSPEIGYSFNNWLDAGLGLNLIYTSIASNTFYNPTDTKLRQLNYGGGPFIRVYPVSFLFLQGQFEENWTKVKVKQDMYSYKQTVNAPSLIAGIGYTQRVVGQGGYYFMVGLDLLKNQYSPYVAENSVGQLVAQPIIRAGFNFYLKPSKGAARESRYQGNHTL